MASEQNHESGEEKENLLDQTNISCSGDQAAPSSTSEKLCVICKMEVSDPKEMFRPCGCNTVAHVNCAMTPDLWSSEKCPQCAQPFKKADIYPVLEQSVSTCDSRWCVACNNTKYQEKTAARHDLKMVRPCFCGVDYHHGCLVKMLEENRKCHICGEPYRYFKYGSVKDYFRRYTYQYVVFSFILLFLVSIASLALYQSLCGEGSFSLARWVLLVIGCSLLCVSILCAFTCVRHTMFRRIPRFQQRYGQITMLDYTPDVVKHLTKKEEHKPYLNDVSRKQLLYEQGDENDVLKSTSTTTAVQEPKAQFMFGTRFSASANETTV